MDFTTVRYDLDGGWSAPLPDLDSPNTLVLAFASPSFRDCPEPLEELRERYPRAAYIGCSTAGEIHGTTISDDSIAVAICRFHRSRVRAMAVAAPSMDHSRRAGERIGVELRGEDLRGVLVLSDGLTVNGSELVRGLSSVLGDDVVVTGGLAGDGDRFEHTWVVDGGSPRSGYLVAAGLYGDDLVIGHGSQGGWDMFGPERRVTRSEANVLYEVDGKPALRLYRDYLGERAAGLPATALLFPLALRAAPDGQERVVRTVLSIDEEAQSLTFAGDIPEGSLAQLMRANFDRLVDGASGAALAATDSDDAPAPGLAIAISCVGRRLVLGERTEEEIEATLEYLPRETRQLGFYSYGEISPHASGRCELHNQTMTMTTIAERGG